uniref:Uncharacterized protein n=1 Tax=Arundo donax TaxID=35708 RepID=A0A0A9GTK0_ARUDO
MDRGEIGIWAGAGGVGQARRRKGALPSCSC